MKSIHSNATILTPVTAGGQDRGPDPHPRPGSEAGRGTKGSVSARALGDAQRRELGHSFPFPLPGEGELPQVPQSPASPLPPIPTPARPRRARVSAVTSPHPAPKCEPAAAGPARGKAAPGAGTGVVPSPAAPRSLGERSPLGRQRPSLALPGREGGEGRGRGSLQAAPPSERAPRGPLLLGRKARRAPPRARGRSALCW